ncbi:hypothetical protein [Nonomuraea insulae]|uniref:Uncharacterized protein n=1 Tax=Nonomuraea insulae TaxID=1616787 RepID=A0ABW1DC15_9ACTN
MSVALAGFRSVVWNSWYLTLIERIPDLPDQFGTDLDGSFSAFSSLLVEYGFQVDFGESRNCRRAKQRADMVAQQKERGSIRSAAVAKAFAKVPHEKFAPEGRIAISGHRGLPAAVEQQVDRLIREAFAELVEELGVEEELLGN